MLDATMWDECPYKVGDIVKSREGSERPFKGYARIERLGERTIDVRDEYWDIKTLFYRDIQKVV